MFIEKTSTDLIIHTNEKNGNKKKLRKNQDEFELKKIEHFQKCSKILLLLILTVNYNLIPKNITFVLSFNKSFLNNQSIKHSRISSNNI